MITTTNIAGFVVGLVIVILNKHLGILTGQWQKMLFGRDFSILANRIAYIVVGVLAMVVAIVSSV